jgi:hypothetical protein
MKHQLTSFTTDQLVERFVKIALEQDHALLHDEIAKFNKLYDQMEIVKESLMQRPGDERRALLGLYEHPNAQVRLKAAIATLAIAPEAARRALQRISDRAEYPQAPYARDMLDES